MGLFDFLFGKKKSSSSQDKTPFQSSPSEKMSNSSMNDYGKSTFDIKDLIGVDLGGGFSLVPLDMGFLEDDKFPLFATLTHGTPNVAKWLPGFDISTPESFLSHLRANILRTELGLGFSYIIRFRGGAIGMFFVNTPSYNKTTIGFPHWTIDFFLVDIFQGRGLMPKMLLGFMFFLKDRIGISEIYSIVDSRNLQCLAMFDNCLFFKKKKDMVFTDPSTGNRAEAFYCNLQSLNSPF